MNYSTSILNLLLLIVFLASCTSKTQTEVQIKNIDVATAHQLLNQDKNMVVLDVRTPEEFAAGHIEGAVNINIQDKNFPKKVGELDKTKSYIVHCAANVENGRSDKSLEIMTSSGFNSLMSMEGGFAAWQQDGRSVVEDE
ncbi:rhodanese-like domain-containing protein [Fulvivirgaceae bacterium BMA10]|uniref:Rhodanese-like domain-containing protein n=1 Tax=Splendidivirga corallicola TaxID=3051826 RepID=A0ABT8KRA2_9BACT|nr:rhodanese-like domain-containing protein [Fulvivirgaceae bacterium BMA10]